MNTGLYITGRYGNLARLYIKGLSCIFYKGGKSENIVSRENPKAFLEHYYIHRLMFKNYKL